MSRSAHRISRESSTCWRARKARSAAASISTTSPTRASERPIAENPEFDVFSGFISRDGKSVQRYCYLAHVRICETSDPKLNEHMKDVRKFFKDSANVYVVDSSDDSQTLLLFVEGPSDPPAYFHYRTDKHEIALVGLQQEAMANKLMPTATLIEYQARDGHEAQRLPDSPAWCEATRPACRW